MRHDEKVLDAIHKKIRPYQSKDIAMATKLSKRVVERTLRDLEASGLVKEQWNGPHGPFWIISGTSRRSLYS